jgi:site-specific DNA recombinase
MTDMEKKTFMQSFIESIEIYHERQKDGHYVKAINFNFPVSYNGELVTTISPLKETTVEMQERLRKEDNAHG